MVELVLAGVIIGAVMAAAAVTGVRDRCRRRAEREEAGRSSSARGRPGHVESEQIKAARRPGSQPFGEPIPSGWTATGRPRTRDGG